MRRLVADLLLLARGDAGRVIQREQLDLAQIAVEAAAELGPISTDHEIVLEAQPVQVEGVRDELYRVTLNLIENAVRHTPPSTEIDVRTDTEDGYARLVVQDNGPGIPAELRQAVFERFVSGDEDRGGSFGLGLAIVKAVATSHGGSVDVTDAHPDDPEHPGARFVVLLPLAPRPAPSVVGSGERSG
jgi:signal transduction histidine kinase